VRPCLKDSPAAALNKDRTARQRGTDEASARWQSAGEAKVLKISAVTTLRPGRLLAAIWEQAGDRGSVRRNATRASGLRSQ